MDEDPRADEAPVGHAVHAEPDLEIRIRVLQLEALYVDPDVDKLEVCVLCGHKVPPEFKLRRVKYEYPSATTMRYAPQKYEPITYRESALSTASAQPEGRAR